MYLQSSQSIKAEKQNFFSLENMTYDGILKAIFIVWIFYCVYFLAKIKFLKFKIEIIHWLIYYI